MQDILSFRNEHRWLSNFWPAKVLLDGVRYPSVEHAYQAAKTHPDCRSAFLSCTASGAKRLGRQFPIRIEWEQEKLYIMRGLVAQKFSAQSDLAKQLLATGDAQLVEGNDWGDTFWGVCRGTGQNHLGKILMQRRGALRIEASSYLATLAAAGLRFGLLVVFALDAGKVQSRLSQHVDVENMLTLSLLDDPIHSARRLFSFLRSKEAHGFAVGGSPVAALKMAGWDRIALNAHVADVLGTVHRHRPLNRILLAGKDATEMAVQRFGKSRTGVRLVWFSQEESDARGVLTLIEGAKPHVFEQVPLEGLENVRRRADARCSPS